MEWYGKGGVKDDGEIFNWFVWVDSCNKINWLYRRKRYGFWGRRDIVNFVCIKLSLDLVGWRLDWIIW